MGGPDEYRHIRSNMVYQMDYSISENTRYDSAAQKSVPYSWTLRWSLRTNAPGGYRQEKIAGQDRKVFASREELDKYLNGRIKAHDHYFTEISPAIPKEYADCFKVKRLPAPRLHHRGGGTGKSRRTSHAGRNRAAAADHSHPGKEGTRERSIFHFS